jgi:hypothetical protein
MIAYDRLSQIIPADQALACKALQVSLQQINSISKMELPQLAQAAKNLETTKDLPLITAQKTVVPAAVANYFTGPAGMGIGTGECNSILTVDCLGTAIGWVNANALSNVAATLKSSNTAGVQAVYTNMSLTLSGAFTEQVVNVSPPPDYLYRVVIPSGPGAGTYPSDVDGYPTAIQAINLAFSAGLIPAGQAACAGFASGQAAAANSMNAEFKKICQQMGNEQDLQFRAGLRFSDFFANLIPNSQQSTFGLIFDLPSFGLNTVQGDVRTYMEGIANISTQTGQAIVGAMREGANQVALDASGIQAAAHVPVTPAQPQTQGTFIPSTYTPDQARLIDRNFP